MPADQPGNRPLNLSPRHAPRRIKRFDKKDLEISTLKGTVRMSNVEIKLDEIDAMCLPISPKMIFIGHVKADVPFLVRAVAAAAAAAKRGVQATVQSGASTALRSRARFES